MVSLFDFNQFISFEEAKQYYNKMYEVGNDLDKILLKCWLYVCECQYKALKKCMLYDDFKSEVKLYELIAMVKGFLIDVSDVGGIDRAISLLVNKGVSNND